MKIPVVKYDPKKTEPEIKSIPLDQVEPPEKPLRSEIDKAGIEKLANSIKECEGVIQPITVRQVGAERYKVVVGHRRYLAAKEAGLSTIPAIVKEPRDWIDEVVTQLAENLARKDLNPIDEARAYKKLQDEGGLSSGEISRKVGRSDSQVRNLLRLLNLPEPIQQAILHGQLIKEHGLELLKVSDRDAQLTLAEECIRGDWTAKHLQFEIKKRDDPEGELARTMASQSLKRTGQGSEDSPHSSGFNLSVYFTPEELEGIKMRAKREGKKPTDIVSDLMKEKVRWRMSFLDEEV